MTSRRDRPERELTDESLAGERRKTDDELVKRASALEEDADNVVATARRRADEVLGRARSAADSKLAIERGGGGGREVVDAERRLEDAVTGRERAVADDGLAAERAERRAAMTALLALERHETDEHLLGERERADQQLLSRDDFLGVVSHDLRNMLGGMALSAASLLGIDADDPVRRAIAKDAQRIQRYTGRMARLVGDLLDVVSIEAGHLAVETERHDATQLLRETQDAFQAVAAAKGLSIRAEVAAGSLLGQFDHERILQVLANLVGNAIKFTPQSGRVDLVVEPVDGAIRFTVADTGRGIETDQLGRIFDRFWQTGAKSYASGLGLGLYISRCIVEAHGGRIWAESEPGRGSSFFFTLPPARDPAAER